MASWEMDSSNAFGKFVPKHEVSAGIFWEYNF